MSHPLSHPDTRHLKACLEAPTGALRPFCW